MRFLVRHRDPVCQQAAVLHSREGGGMALIDCAECGKQVSDKAAACPHCGNPMAATAPQTSVPPALAPTSVETRSGATVTTQATGKTYKVIEVVGAGIFLLGLVSCAIAEGLSGGSIALILLGSAVYIAGGIGAWWDHG